MRRAFHIPAANLGARLGRRQEILISIGLILVAFWAARHLLHGSFGFYEDDYTLVVRAMASDWPEVREFLINQFSQFAGQGRPLQHGLVFLLGYLSGRLGGLLPAYWLAYLVVAMNCVLFYLLLRKLGDGLFALVGGLAYALFSADTTQGFLYHAFGLQPALTFLILASLAYLSKRRVLAYALSLGSLLSYETTYLVFLGVPLLEREWNRSWSKRLALHAAIGEERVLGLDPADLLQVSLLHTLQGPLVAVGSYILRPIQAALDMDLGIGLVSLISLVVFWAALNWMSSSNRPDPGERARLVRLLIAGLVLVALAYPLTFTVRAYAISGRDTRVHLAAAVGAAIVFASAWQLALTISAEGRLRRVVPAGLSAMLALLVGFGLVVQKDYAKAWELQKVFWSSLVPFVPDLGEGTVILVDPAGLIDTRHIDANTWSMPLVLQYIYEFPSDWDPVPRAHRLLPDWRARSLHNQLEIKAVDFKWEYVVVPWDKAFVLRTSAGEVVGRFEVVEIQEERFKLNQMLSPGLGSFRSGYLYDELVQSPESDATSHTISN